MTITYTPEAMRQRVLARASEDFEAGKDLSDNPYPWNSAAYLTWEQEWMRLISERSAQSSPDLMIRQGGATRIDPAQVEA